ncbi:tetratricopeptide repeat protein [bacterium]|nr:tetratricopeptide repeat protein [bacterium]
MSTEEQLSQIKGFSSIQQWYEDNKKNVNIAAIVFIVVLGAGYYYFKFHKPNTEKEAHAQLFTAERYLRQDSLNLALNGDGMAMGTRAVADEYGGTKAGNLASYYTGSILLRQGQFEDAITYLKDCSFDDQIHAASRITLLGDCYSELGDYKKAADHYMDAANKRENDITGPVALRKAAFAYAAAGEYEDAIDALKEMQTTYPDAEEVRTAEKLIGQYEAELDSK